MGRFFPFTLLLSGLALSCLVSVSPAQNAVVPRPPITREVLTASDIGNLLAPRPTDITARQANAKALAFLAAAGLPAPHETSHPTLVCNGWLQRTWAVMFGGLLGKDQDYNFEIDSRSGTVKEFKNLRLQYQQLYQMKARSNKPVLIKTHQQAEQIVWKYAKRIGLPADAQLLPLRWYGDNDPEHSDGNRAGAIIAGFVTPLPGGYPAFMGIQPNMTLVVDPLGGELAEFRQEWRFKFLPPQPRLTAKQAIDLATPLANAFVAKHPKFNGFAQADRPLPASGASLAYVSDHGVRVTGGEFIHPPAKIIFPVIMRLAWVVKFGPSSIWIDAETGTQLGAENMAFK